MSKYKLLKMNFLKQKKLYFIFAVIILGIYGLAKFVLSEKITIPENFTNSRMQSALISESIIDLSNQIKENVSKINSLDEEKKYKEAFNLLNETNIKILDIRQKAIQLSTELEKMTKELGNIKAGGAEPLALSAITNRLTIISHLINYSDYLFQLNLALQDRFYGKNNRDQILSLIDKINAEVEAINQANSKSNIDMAKFDDKIKSK
jgi:predicted transcriptional regulator